MANNEEKLVFLDDLPETYSLEVPAGENKTLRLVALKQLPAKLHLVVNVHRDALFRGAFVDFTDVSTELDLQVNLLEEGAQCDWHLAVLSHGKANKSFSTSVKHIAPHTQALMSNYGIAREQSHLVFTGTSAIEHGAVKANTRQEAKIIVFDPGANGLASPILLIGENDVQASHAAVVGRLNEDHLFYLESRGVSEEDAKRLIALGYLKPIERYYDDPTLVEKIDAVIEGEIA